MGKTTNYQIYRPDGTMNRVRGRPDDRTYLWTSTEEGAALEAAYDDMYGNNRWETIMTPSLRFFPSMWNNSHDLKNSILPLDKRPFTYTLFSCLMRFIMQRHHYIVFKTVSISLIGYE